MKEVGEVGRKIEERAARWVVLGGRVIVEGFCAELWLWLL